MDHKMKLFIILITLITWSSSSVIVQWKIKSPNQNEDWKPVSHWRYGSTSHADDWSFEDYQDAPQRRNFDDGHAGTKENI